MTSTYRTTSYQGNRHSPAAIAGAIALHVAVAGAVLLIPAEIIRERFIPPFIIKNIPLDKPPPADKPKPQPDAKQTDIHVTTPKPIVPIPADPDPWTDSDPPIPSAPIGGTGPIADPIPADPPRNPVIVGLRIDPEHQRDFQPDYPPRMQREQMEGVVTVRVRIGTDGRVLTVERIQATNDAFWEATQQQALRRWRFLPETRDGVAVVSEKVMTVRFRLQD
jgi:protein TonB